MIAQEPQVVLKTILRTRAKNNFAGKDAPWGERAHWVKTAGHTKKPETHAHAHAHTHTFRKELSRVLARRRPTSFHFAISLLRPMQIEIKTLSHLTHKNNAYIEQQGVFA